MERLSGKVALITGGAQGIGAAHARIFAQEGAKVAVCDIRDSGEEVAAAVRAAGGEAIFIPLDVTSGSQWAQAVETTVATFGGLTTLINNAGIYRVVGLEEET